jgi:hypothetical protein
MERLLLSMEIGIVSLHTIAEMGSFVNTAEDGFQR